MYRTLEAQVVGIFSGRFQVYGLSGLWSATRRSGTVVSLTKRARTPRLSYRRALFLSFGLSSLYNACVDAEG